MKWRYHRVEGGKGLYESIMQIGGLWKLSKHRFTVASAMLGSEVLAEAIESWLEVDCGRTQSKEQKRTS